MIGPSSRATDTPADVGEQRVRACLFHTESLWRRTGVLPPTRRRPVINQADTMPAAKVIAKAVRYSSGDAFVFMGIQEWDM